MNDKQISNPLNTPISSLTSAVSGACQLQHASALMGLSRRRLDKDDVFRLIDSRQIRWAWDIARKNARRPEIRIWRQSLLDYLAQENGPAAPTGDNLSADQVIESILPKPAAITLRTATVAAGDLRRRFLCCQRHLRGLIADGELWSGSPQASMKTLAIFYQSTFDFLRRRCLSL
jgi:hypothetical protein